MNTVLKFKSKDRKIGFSSDFHIGHNKPWIVDARKFLSIDEHDEFIISNINKNFDKDDILFLFGDNTCGCPEDKARNLLHAFICQNIYSLWGNHPNPLKRFYSQKIYDDFGLHSTEVYPFKIGQFTFIGDVQNLIINNQHFVLSHHPLSIWDEDRNGGIQLCGHSHGSFDGSNLEGDCSKKRKQLDCSVDVALKYSNYKKCFFELNEVLELMEDRKIISFDHHIHEKK